jgi:hypothetical protein
VRPNPTSLVPTTSAPVVARPPFDAVVAKVLVVVDVLAEAVVVVVVDGAVVAVVVVPVANGFLATVVVVVAAALTAAAVGTAAALGQAWRTEARMTADSWVTT